MDRIKLYEQCSKALRELNKNGELERGTYPPEVEEQLLRNDLYADAACFNATTKSRRLEASQHFENLIIEERRAMAAYKNDVVAAKTSKWAILISVASLLIALLSLLLQWRR